ncbi:bifunctional hydroxymethylpyrimidine kinase/phosphomethylpyrimidine kinase [Intestinibacillus massiliensis]|uniref:bifunctional hydroxymethylpyrimidine kinase/phosphomethylpyrimidine kinase n=1 Tax=Intestinibacillus massiliensis TaxID=1871029 RepID=UPI000B3558C0|nr:bifunctional hydroxymethylpyrimidine kinase/phosphomethylpyrimidine kinase [Intestinibacillus massiliensis]
MAGRTLPAVLTIAGSDCSGGAGIQADLKTFTALGVYGESCITAVTAQNTACVHAVHPVPAGMVRAQLEAVFTDIVPDAVKIGMLGTAEAIRTVADALRAYAPRYTVLDPVMISTSGTRLLDADASGALMQALMPLVTLITPNLPEAAEMTGLPVRTRGDMLAAARALSAQTGAAVLLKGGHLEDGTSDDLLLDGGEPLWLGAARLQNPNTHGTGCTLSSAVAAYLAQGLPLVEAVRRGKAYITDAIAWGLDLGAGNGPLCHMARIL